MPDRSVPDLLVGLAGAGEHAAEAVAGGGVGGAPGGLARILPVGDLGADVDDRLRDPAQRGQARRPDWQSLESPDQWCGVAEYPLFAEAGALAEPRERGRR